MELIIVTGLSGAGKSSAAAALEDMGYYCVDNMPIQLIPNFMELCMVPDGRYEKVALVTDVRAGENFDALIAMLEEAKAQEFNLHVLYIEAELGTIVKRYKETRRRHPLNPQGGDIEKAVEQESVLLAPLRERASLVMDTTDMNLNRLRMTIYSAFSSGTRPSASVTVMSFGFKHGIPPEADFVFDVRFLPNPFYVQRLRNLTGLDGEVAEYVFDNGHAEQFSQNMALLLCDALPDFLEEGKSNIVVAIGCTGGHHRSVAVAKRLGELMSGRGYSTSCRHRDIER